MELYADEVLSVLMKTRILCIHCHHLWSGIVGIFSRLKHTFVHFIIMYIFLTLFLFVRIEIEKWNGNFCHKNVNQKCSFVSCLIVPIQPFTTMHSLLGFVVVVQNFLCAASHKLWFKFQFDLQMIFMEIWIDWVVFFSNSEKIATIISNVRCHWISCMNIHI